MHRPARESRDGRRADSFGNGRPPQQTDADSARSNDAPSDRDLLEPSGSSEADYEDDPEPVLVRLNKYLAAHGVASRRRSDELISEGKVSIDDEIVTDLGTKVDPTVQRVEVDGVILRPEQVRHRYYLLNKPSGVVCTNDEREAKPRAIDLIGDRKKGRIYTVGRLDEDTIGLVLLTNDGDFAHRIMHPRHGVPKTYLVKLMGRIDDEAIQRVREGVYLAEGRTAGARVLVKQRSSKYSRLLVTLNEGKNREIRRVFARMGFKVVDLKRTRIGSLDDRGLKVGSWRPLTRGEVQELSNWVDGDHEEERRGRGGRRREGGPQRGRNHRRGDSSHGGGSRAGRGGKHGSERERVGAGRSGGYSDRGDRRPGGGFGGFGGEGGRRAGAESRQTGQRRGSSRHVDPRQGGSRPADFREGDSRSGGFRHGGSRQFEPRNGDPRHAGAGRGDSRRGGPRDGDWGPRDGDARRGDARFGHPRREASRPGSGRYGNSRPGDPRQGDARHGGSRHGDPRRGGPRQGEGRGRDARQRGADERGHGRGRGPSNDQPPRGGRRVLRPGGR